MFNEEDILKIADLAHVSLRRGEMKSLKKDLSKILNYVEKLKEVDTSEVDFESISPIKNRIRKDEVVDFKKSKKEKMVGIEKNEDGYFEVGRI